MIKMKPWVKEIYVKILKHKYKVEDLHVAQGPSYDNALKFFSEIIMCKIWDNKKSKSKPKLQDMLNKL